MSLGLVLAVILQLILPVETVDVATIEREAKKLGMNYPSEFKVSTSTSKDNGESKEETKEETEKDTKKESQKDEKTKGE